VPTAASKNRKSKYVVKVKARDRLTGVKQLRIGTKRSVVSQGTVSYRVKSRVRLPQAKRPYVRVSDGAGKWTGWLKVRVK